MERWSRGCGQVIWRLSIGGIEDVERWSRGYGKGGLEGVGRSYGG